MRLLRCSIPLAITIACLSSPGATLGDEVIRSKFVKEYPAASRRLEDFYQKLVMLGSESSGDRTSRWEFRGNADSLCSIVTTQDGASAVVVANQKLSFLLEKKAGASRYAVSSMGPAPPTEFDDLKRTVRRKVLPQSASYTMLADLIATFASEKSFKIKEAEEKDSIEGLLYAIDWENTPAGGPKRRGQFTFLADGSWALKSYDLYFGDMKLQNSDQLVEIGRHAVVEYAGSQDGLPLLKRVKTWNSGPTGLSPATVYEVQQIRPGPAPEAEFQLDHFGIRTDPIGEPTPLSSYLLAMAAFSAMLVVVFSYIGRRAKRRVGEAA